MGTGRVPVPRGFSVNERVLGAMPGWWLSGMEVATRST